MSAVEETKVAATEVAAAVVPAVVAEATPAPAVEEADVAEKPAEKVVAEAAPVVEASTAAPTEPAAASPAPVEEAAAAPVVETPPKEVTPITTGFLNVRHFFIFDKRVFVAPGTSGPVSQDKLKAIIKRDVARPSLAWASVTGEGLLLCSDSEEQTLIDQIIRLDNATIKTSDKDKKKIILKVDNNTKTYDLIAKDADDRDAWIKGLESLRTIADAKKAEVEASDSYKKTLESPAKAKAEPVEAKAEKPAEKAVEKAVEETAVATDVVPEIKPEAKSPADPKPSHRTSILGNIFFRRSTDQRQAEEAKAEPVVESAVVAEPAVEAAAEPEVAAPAEDVKSDDEKAAKVSRRHTAFLKGLFPKKESKPEEPVAETTDTPAAAEEPKKTEEAPKVDVVEEAAKPAEEESKAVEEPKEKAHTEGVVRRILGTIRSRVPSGGDASAAAPAEPKVEKSPEASPETKRFNRISKYLNFNKVRVAEVTDAAPAKSGAGDAVDSGEKPPQVDVEGLAPAVAAVEPIAETAPIDATKAAPVTSTAA